MTTLLLPGTSQTSLAIAAHLHASAATYVLGTRSPTTTYTDASNLTHPTLTISLTDPTTWAPAFAATTPPITTLYLLPPPTIADFYDPTTRFLAFAATHGVTRILWLSASLLPRGGPAHGAVHQFLHELAASPQHAALQYAVLRPTWFAQNFTARAHFHSASLRDGARVYSATQKGRVPWVDVRDIGAVGYHALTAAGAASKEGREYLVLGPELLSYDDVAATLSGVLGREVRHVGLSVEGLTERFVELGLPREYAGVLAGMDAAIEAGAEERVGGCVAEVTGRAPRSLKDVFEEAKGQGAWD